MHFPTQILALTALLTPALGITVSYDPGYSDSSRSLAAVSCSDGANGLLTKGYTTQGSLPSFPRIGGASTIAGWNSPNCGTCYELSWQGRSVTILAIDHAAQGFNIATEAMNQLTNGQAVALGRVDASWKQVAKSACGL